MINTTDKLRAVVSRGLVLGGVKLRIVNAPRPGNVCVKCFFYQAKPGSDRDCIALRKIRPDFDCFHDSRPDGRDVIFVPENGKDDSR